MRTTATRRLGVVTLSLVALGATLVGASGSPSQAEPAAGQASTVTAASVATVSSAAATAQAVVAAAAPRVSAAHPYSDPVYLPVRQTVTMDCYRNNDPKCGRTRDWQLNLISLRDVPQGGLYAMGAGRFSIRQIGKNCGPGSPGPVLGTIVQIDHGDGVISRYTHVSNRDIGRLRALNGRFVAAGQWIGWMGNTGAGAANPEFCKHFNYVDFWVQRGRQNVKYELKTLISCTRGSRQLWPRAQYPQYPVWNRVPVKTQLPTEARLGEVNDGSCIPSGAPATVDRPRTPLLRAAGRGRLAARWATPRGASRTLLDIQVRRGRGWVTDKQVRLAPRVTSAFVRGYRPGRPIRVVVSHRNGVGVSAPSKPSAVRAVPR